MIESNHIPPYVQVHLHELGLIGECWYTRDDNGMVVFDMEKLRRYMEENDGDVPH